MKFLSFELERCLASEEFSRQTEELNRQVIEVVKLPGKFFERQERCPHILIIDDGLILLKSMKQ